MFFGKRYSHAVHLLPGLDLTFTSDTAVNVDRVMAACRSPYPGDISAERFMRAVYAKYPGIRTRAVKCNGVRISGELLRQWRATDLDN